MDEQTAVINPGNYYVNKNGGGGIPASALKIFAMAVMLTDHAAAVFIESTVPAGQDVPVSDVILRMIGRLAFPIFAFLIAEGARRTHNMPKYMVRLLIFGIISEIPFDWVLIDHCGSPVNLYKSNVYFTLLAGLVSIWCIQKFQSVKSPLRFLYPLGILPCLAVVWVMTTDYSIPGVLAIIVFYLFSDKKKPVKTLGFILAVMAASLSFPSFSNVLSYLNGAQNISIGMSFNVLEMCGCFSIPLMTHYNGKRGIHINKYVFYGFYPAHILILGLIYLIVSKI